MARFADADTLLRVSKAKKALLLNWKEGATLEARTGRSVEELRDRAVADRVAFAVTFRRRGESLLTRDPPHYRDSISRFYYAMYHVMRATAFFAHGGDDFQEHSALPGKTPEDFVNRALWQNTLKDARTVRNAADYDPYPKSDRSWQKDALTLRENARDLIKICRAYLRAKGCSYI